jgi:hypothetical protein
VTVDDHPSFEDLSAYHDGEAPEWAAHVADCATCGDTVASLSSLSAAVAEVDANWAGAARGDPVARAIAAAGAVSDGHPDAARETGTAPSPAVAPPPRPTPLPSRGRWLVAAVAAAAVVVVAAGLTAVLRRGNASDSTTTAAGRPQSELANPEAAVGGAGPAADSATPAVVGGELGDIPDRATLLAKVGPLLSSGRSLAGEGGAGVPAAPPVRSSVPGVADVPAPRVVGTRPCEGEARGARTDLGDVVYVATARAEGRPAVVLAFAPASGAGPVTVQMLTTSDCRLVLQATTP